MPEAHSQAIVVGGRADEWERPKRALAYDRATVAVACERLLVALGRPAYMLDGDNLRHGLNGDLGFSAADRSENVRRVAEVAKLLGDAGVMAIVSLVSP